MDQEDQTIVKKKYNDWDKEKALLNQQIQFAHYQIHQLRTQVQLLRNTNQATLLAFHQQDNSQTIQTLEQQLKTLKHSHQQLLIQTQQKIQIQIKNKQTLQIQHKQSIQNFTAKVQNLKLQNQDVLNQNQSLKHRILHYQSLMQEYTQTIQKYKSAPTQQYFEKYLAQLKDVYQKEKNSMMKDFITREKKKDKQWEEKAQEFQERIKQIQDERDVRVKQLKNQVSQTSSYYKQTLQKIQKSYNQKLQELSSRNLQSQIQLNRHNALLIQQNSFIKKQLQEQKQQNQRAIDKYQKKVDIIRKQMYSQNDKKEKDALKMVSQLQTKLKLANNRVIQLQYQSQGLSKQKQIVQARIQYLKSTYRQQQQRMSQLQQKQRFKTERIIIDKQKMQEQMQGLKERLFKQNQKLVMENQGLNQKIKFYEHQNKINKEDLDDVSEKFKFTVLKLMEKKNQLENRGKQLQATLQLKNQELYQIKQIFKSNQKRCKVKQSNQKNSQFLGKHQIELNRYKTMYSQQQNKNKQLQKRLNSLTYEYQIERAKRIVGSENTKGIQSPDYKSSRNISIRRQKINQISNFSNYNNFKYN